MAYFTYLQNGGIPWGYNPRILTFDQQLPGTS